ncbi:transglycosylase [Brevundimonas sp. NIBR11]|uniref:transglycosylase n=1 Tax=Brevundimonas sp. NIBR11 TaxID=3015999 RepID=UPI0022F0C06D|nr:transglycosylase [Brevundimonas sp. NIBR11]
MLEYADVVVAAGGAFALAWIADLLTGRRGLFAASLVAFVGAACGWFLAVRVFGASTMDEFGWVLWSAAGTILCLITYYLFRNTR